MPTLSFPMVFGLIMSAAVFLVVLGIAQARRAAGGSEDFQARLAAYGGTTAGAAALPTTAGFRDTLNHLFQPAADRPGPGGPQKSQPPRARPPTAPDPKTPTPGALLVRP